MRDGIEREPSVAAGRGIAGPGGEVRVRGRDVTITRDGDTQTRPLADGADLRAIAAEYFGFDLPELATLPIAT